MKSKLEEPFNEVEKEELSKCPNINEFIKINHPIKDSDDWRLTYQRGKQIVVKNRNYPGKGVKIIQIVLKDQGLEELEQILRKKEAK